MWKEIVEYMEKVCSSDNKNELMSVYLTYIISPNPLKRIKKCKQFMIASDVIKIIDIKQKYNNEPDAKVLDILYNEEYKSKHISEKIKNEKMHNTKMPGINELIDKESKNIEMAFILKNIENYYDYEYLKFIVTILIAILSITLTIKTSFIRL